MRYFATAVDAGSIAKAAVRLRVAQPAISRQIHALERELGVTLLHRDRHGVRPTEAGQSLLQQARLVFETLERGVRRAQMANEGRLGTVRLGLGRVALENTHVGQVISDMRERLPDVTIVAVQVSSLEQAEALRSRSIDVALGIRAGADRSNGRLREEVVARDSVRRALLPVGHPLAGERAVSGAQLAGEQLVMIDPTMAPGYEALYESLRALECGAWQECATIDTVYSLVASGRAWTTHLDSMPPPPGTVTVPLEGLDFPVNVIVRWRTDDVSRLTANVVATLCDALRPRGLGDLVTSDRGRRRSNPRAAALEQHDREPVPTRAARGATHVEARQLRSFAAVFQKRSLTEAAPRLSLTQSGLSRQIRALERAVGVTLLTRDRKGVMPTPAGEAFEPEASAVLSLLHHVVSYAQRAARGVSGVCRVGVLPQPLSGELLLESLKQLHERAPDVAIEIQEMASAQQVQSLRAGEIDVGLAFTYPGFLDDADLDADRLTDDAIDCVMVARKSALATKSEVNAGDLDREPLALFDREAAPRLHDALVRSFEDLGLKLRPSVVYRDARSGWRIAADGAAWTIGTRRLRQSPPAGLVGVPVKGLRIPAGIALLWRRAETDASVRTVIEAFRRVSREEWAARIEA